MRIWRFLLIISCLIFAGRASAFSPNFSVDFLRNNQPSSVQEVKDETKQDAEPVKSVSTQSEIVRVGIGNQSFSSFVYKKIGVYGTAPVDVYKDGVKLFQVPANSNIFVLINPDFSYTLKDNSGEELAHLEGIIKFTSSGGCLGVTGLKRAGKPALYHGYFEIMRAKEGNQFNLVNKLPVEFYLRGVVPNEMPVNFGLEALKAQAVAARNYVLSPRTKATPNYDVVDSVASQVYYGANTEKELSNRAVSETEGIVALDNWDMILALYSSTAGGYTESYSNAFSDPASGQFPSAEKSYLKATPDMLYQGKLNSEEDALAFYKSRPDSYDIRSPYFRWTMEWDADELKAQLQNTLITQSSTGYIKPKFVQGDELGNILELKTVRRGDSGKIIELEIITNTQTYKVYKELVIRRLLTKNGKALPSANVVFENVKDEDGNLLSIKAYGGGYGHGVGLSQFGAGFMGSELHIPYDKILQHYYKGIILGTKPVIVSSEKSQNAVTQTFYTGKQKAHLVIDNKFQLSKLDVNINGQDYTLDIPTSFFGGNRCARVDISKYIKIGKNQITYYYPKSEGGHKAVRLFIELVERNGADSIGE